MSILIASYICARVLTYDPSTTSRHFGAETKIIHDKPFNDLHALWRDISLLKDYLKLKGGEIIYQGGGTSTSPPK